MKKLTIPGKTLSRGDMKKIKGGASAYFAGCGSPCTPGVTLCSRPCSCYDMGGGVFSCQVMP